MLLQDVATSNSCALSYSPEQKKEKKAVWLLTVLQFLYRQGFWLPCRMLSKPLLGPVEECLLIGSLKIT